MPVGPLKRAAAPIPSADPTAPALPAIVVTKPAGVSLRIVSLPRSATYRLPLPSTAMADGRRNEAAAPLPSADPTTPALPARVVTTPAGVMRRIV